MLVEPALSAGPLPLHGERVGERPVAHFAGVRAEQEDGDVRASVRCLRLEEPLDQRCLMRHPAFEREVRVLELAAELVHEAGLPALLVLEDLVLDRESAALREPTDLEARQGDAEAQLAGGVGHSAAAVAGSRPARR